MSHLQWQGFLIQERCFRHKFLKHQNRNHISYNNAKITTHALKKHIQKMHNAKDFVIILEIDTQSNKYIFIKTNCNPKPVRIKILIYFWGNLVYAN